MQWDNRRQISSFINWPIGHSKPLFGVIFEALNLLQPELTAGWLAGWLSGGPNAGKLVNS